MTNQNLLITGISGFVGKNLHSFLQNNAFLSLHGASTQPGNLALGSGKALSYEKLLDIDGHSFDHYIHLAGKAHDLKNTSEDREYFEVNYGLTKKLYELFLNDDAAQTFIYISSVKAAKDQVDGILEEDVICTPLTAYGKSKRMAEEYILKNLPKNKRVYILRPCMIHGPGNKGNLNLLHKVVQKGIPYPLAAFQNQRSFLSIDNLLFVIDKLLHNNTIPSGIYNVSDDEPISTKELIKIIGQAGNYPVRLWAVSPTIIKALASAGDKLRLPLNSERLQKLTESYVVDNTKIRKALNISSLPVSSKEGLLATIQSFNK